MILHIRGEQGLPMLRIGAYKGIYRTVPGGPNTAPNGTTAAERLPSKTRRVRVTTWLPVRLLARKHRRPAIVPAMRVQRDGWTFFFMLNHAGTAALPLFALASSNTTTLLHNPVTTLKLPLVWLIVDGPRRSTGNTTVPIALHSLVLLTEGCPSAESTVWSSVKGHGLTVRCCAGGARPPLL